MSQVQEKPVVETQAKAAVVAAVVYGLSNLYKATDQDVSSYCRAIVGGESLAKIFPCELKFVVRTDEQKEQIKAARHERKEWCKLQKAAITKRIRPKHVELHRISDRGARLGLGFVDTKMVKAAAEAKAANKKNAKAK